MYLAWTARDLTFGVSMHEQIVDCTSVGCCWNVNQAADSEACCESAVVAAGSATIGISSRLTGSAEVHSTGYAAEQKANATKYSPSRGESSP